MSFCHFGGGRDKILTPATRYPLAATTPLTSSQHTDQHGLLRHTGNQRPWRGKSTKSLHFICSLAEQHNKKGRLLAVTLSLNNHTHKPKSNSSDGEILKKDFLFLFRSFSAPTHSSKSRCSRLLWSSLLSGCSSTERAGRVRRAPHRTLGPTMVWFGTRSAESPPASV